MTSDPFIEPNSQAESLRQRTQKQPWFSRLKSPASWLVATLILLLALYLVTMARHLVWGDPTEYTFVADMLGIAHPPGYALITLLGKLFQTVNPFGDIPWRMHLLSVASGLTAASFVFGTLISIIKRNQQSDNNLYTAGILAAVFGALVVTTAANWWQHAIHTNPHIITATFLAVNLFLLTRWWSQSQIDTNSPANRWLFAFSFSAGLGITHHPLTVFAFPAYLLFILWLQPGIWRRWRTWLKMAAFALLGLSVWLYFPIRSSMSPDFGPDTMNTFSGFLDHVLARGISEGLPFYSLIDQLDRLTVFWSLLRLQYSLPVILLALFGLVWLATTGWHGSQSESGRIDNPSIRPLALLYGLAFLSNYLFVINLRAQDVMAYLLGVFLVFGLLSGVGLWGLLTLVSRRLLLDKRAVALLLVALFLLGPALQIVRNGPRLSLHDYDEAAEYVTDVFEWFDGEGENAILLNDWEHMTPLWYSQFVEDEWPDPSDVTPILVSTDLPWLESVFFHLPAQPVYLSGYRQEIAAAGFRLRPRGLFYQVVQPGDTSIPPELDRFSPLVNGDIEIIAGQFLDTAVRAGELVPLTLAMRTVTGTDDYFVPVVTLDLGDRQVTFEFTTDSHLITPLWQPGEVIIERFDFALPADLAEGTYPLSVHLRNLSQADDRQEALFLTNLAVEALANSKPTEHLLANFRQQVGLLSASAGTNRIIRQEAPWEPAIAAQAGESINVTLEWLSLASPTDSYTVFLHLIDLANQPLVTLDYTPLGGSTPTHLWIPKWLPEQRLLDPYRLEIPEELPPGRYLIEVGLYEMTSKRRLHISDAEGNLVGDRYILGAIEVVE